MAFPLGIEPGWGFPCSVATQETAKHELQPVCRPDDSTAQGGGHEPDTPGYTTWW